jgi:type I restriction enzyme, R subunit
MTQALRYAQQLDVPIAYSTNGHGIVEHDLSAGTERDVETFATPAELWSAYQAHHGLDTGGASLLAQSFNRRRVDIDGNVIQPRWYQTVAVHRVLRAIATGSRRALLLMATGTGKTFTAMQIVAKLRAYHEAGRPEQTFRVLYLADLDELLKQPMRKDFRPAFGEDAIRRVKGGTTMSREIYFASYQAMTGPGDVDALFHDYPGDFFDLVIVDECHRGSASVESTWRRVLDHFTSAIQLGPDGHTETRFPRRQLRVLRSTGVRVLAAGRHPGRLPRAFPRASRSAQPGCRGVDSRPRPTRPVRPRDPGRSLQHA